MDPTITPADCGGDEARGLAVFCGGLRWFGVRWGLRWLPAGLRMAGFAGKIVYWPWHGRWTGPLLTVPALWDRNLHDFHGERIAQYLAEHHRRRPDIPLYVLGCSAGACVALRAMEMLPDGLAVEAAALFSAAVDPRHDLAKALRHVRGKLVNTCSVLDWAILGLGTLLGRTGDGTHSVSAGMIGLRTDHEKVVNLPWRPKMILAGRLGGHPTATPPAFVARYVAPLLGIGRGFPS